MEREWQIKFEELRFIDCRRIVRPNLGLCSLEPFDRAHRQAMAEQLTVGEPNIEGRDADLFGHKRFVRIGRGSFHETQFGYASHKRKL